MHDLSAKVFRTYNASVKLQELLGKSKAFTDKDKVEEKKAFYDKCNREVAILCNHKKAEAKNLPEQLGRLEAKIKEKQKELSKLNSEIKKSKASQKNSDAESTAMSVANGKKKVETLNRTKTKLNEAISKL